MKTVEVVDIGGVQAVRLPEEFRFDSHLVSIRREGEAVIVTANTGEFACVAGLTLENWRT